ncbi:MAG: molybdenum cofactor biosynthesis protein MoaE [Gammaproteobacteria bacterium]
MKVLVSPTPFDPLDELRAFEEALGERRRRIGAAATFVGSMRDFNDGSTVESMRLEHYPGMTEQHLERIAEEACARWQLDDALIVHRVGEVHPGDAIVLVAVWSAHRAHAFESCRHIMEDLKSRAPFWKQERTADGQRWVGNNTPGTSDEFPN